MAGRVFLVPKVLPGGDDCGLTSCSPGPGKVWRKPAGTAVHKAPAHWMQAAFVCLKSPVLHWPVVKPTAGLRVCVDLQVHHCVTHPESGGTTQG